MFHGGGHSIRRFLFELLLQTTSKAVGAKTEEDQYDTRCRVLAAIINMAATERQESRPEDNEKGKGVVAARVVGATHEQLFLHSDRQ